MVGIEFAGNSMRDTREGVTDTEAKQEIGRGGGRQREKKGT
jgi:hypothetical protein